MSDRLEQRERLTPLKRLERDASRVRQITGVLVRYGLADMLGKLNIPAFKTPPGEQDFKLANQTKEARIRLALTELGPTFIKVGQLLSTREDMVGPKLAAELSKLQSDTPPDPPEVVATTIAQELGRPISELFPEFEPEAFASASIAQVHRARLWSGEIVAVKVQKRGVQEQVEADISILEAVARLAEDHSETAKDWGAVNIVEEFKRSIHNDLNFNRERKNVEIFEQNFEDDPTVLFPATWPEYSTRRVLTMEYLDGILGNDVQGLHESGEDLEAFAFRGANVYLKMIFRDSFYHADPHPGNLMLLPCGVVGIIDCGTVGRIDEGLREDLESLVEAITQGDVEALTDSLWALSKDQSEEARAGLRTDLSSLLEESEGSLEQINISAILTGMLRIFQRYRLSVRPGLTALLRTLVELDGTSKLLSPKFSLQTVLEPYETESVRRRLDPRRLLQKTRRRLIEWSQFLEHLPKDLSTTLHKIRTGEFRVRIEHRHLDSIINRMVLGVLTASLILGSSLLWSMKAPPLYRGISVIGTIGYLATLFHGWLLYRAIKNTGDVAPDDD